MFTGNEGRFLKSSEAEELKKAYRDKKADLKDDECVRSEFFGIHNLQQILNQPGCVGIRVYQAKRQEKLNGKDHVIPRVVLVGVDEKGEDIRKLAPLDKAGMKDMVSDEGRDGELGDGPVCPPHCK